MGCNSSKGTGVEENNTGNPKEAVKIVFLLGGPGSGKGTVAEKIVETYGFQHISTGDLLRDEVKAGTPLGKQVGEIMSSGGLVPVDTTMDILKAAMEKALQGEKKPTGFLIDGFPRETSQIAAFQNKIGRDCNIVLYLDAPEDVMVKRLLNRGLTSGRADDNEASIKLRLTTYNDKTAPVISHYEAKGMTRKIDASGTVDEVWSTANGYLLAL